MKFSINHLFAISCFMLAGMIPHQLRAEDGLSDRAPFPAESSAISRIAFGSCADETRPQPFWNSIAAQNPDLFLFTGDNVYADQYKGEWIREPALEPISYAYALLGAIPEFKDFRRSVPIIAGWDDHDYGLNDAGAEFPLKEGSKNIMLDFFGVPKDAPVRQRDGLYHARIMGPVGQRVQIIFLDTRWFRSDLRPTDERGAVGKERYLPDPDPAKTMLGEAQWTWLEQQLQKPADLRILVSSIQVLADGHGWEGWHSLPLERQRLYDLINDSGVSSLLILSGDRHVGGLYRRDDIAAFPLYEITSSSLNLSFAKGPVTETGPHQMGQLYGPENFGMIEVDWDRRILSFDLRDMAGDPVRGMTIALDDLAP
ncbi:PhoD-like phosphatase [alpha proteobacterium Q-1]|nr:PhoD-like phosphatase [alpha proteobacterium Q-1]